MKICQDIRLLLQARSTQLMLTDAIVGLVAKGVYLSAKHNVLSLADKDKLLNELENIVGTDDITEAVQPLRFKYEFVNKFGEIKYGQMSQLIRTTSELAASNRAARSELLLLKDYSFTFRELSPLFEILREARNYYAHNTSDREDIGWNGLIISAVTRILERGNFLDKKRVEERAALRKKTTLLFNKLINSQANSELSTSSAEADDWMSQTAEESSPSISHHAMGIIESLSLKQEELLSNSRLFESQLGAISKQIDALSLSSEISFTKAQSEVNPGGENQEIKVPKKQMANEADDRSSDEIQENALEEEPVLASETLISVDMLYEELQFLKSQIKEQYETDSRWLGPSSNILQRAIINTIVYNEPGNMHDVLKYEDVKWRVAKQKELLGDQMDKYSSTINDLLARTAWLKDYQ